VLVVDWLVRLALWLFIVVGYWCWRWRWWLVAGLLLAVTAGVGALVYFRLLAAGGSVWGHLLAVRRCLSVWLVGWCLVPRREWSSRWLYLLVGGLMLAGG
jgi:hypothetical protein